MKITKIVATDEDGVEHMFEGIEGALHVRAINYKPQPYQQRVEVSLLLAPKENVKA